MLAPGKIYAGSPTRIGAHFEDEGGVDVDPATITFTLRSPCGVESTYVYGTDANVVKTSAGDYYAEVTPDRGGRWHWAWSSTGTDKAIRFAGSIVVQEDAFDAY